jgi:hypothetical protein
MLLRVRLKGAGIDLDTDFGLAGRAEMRADEDVGDRVGQGGARGEEERGGEEAGVGELHENEPTLNFFCGFGKKYTFCRDFLLVSGATIRSNS